jgi:hypothetical protein
MDDGRVLRLPAELLEKVIIEHLTSNLSDASRLLKLWNDDTLTPSQISSLQHYAEQTSALLTSGSREEQQQL